MSAVSKENQDDENTDQAKNCEIVYENDARPVDGSSQKRKYGKFRALRSNQQQRLAEGQSNEDRPNDSKLNESNQNSNLNDSKLNESTDGRTEESVPPPKTTEQFIPPTLLANSEANEDKSEEIADDKAKKGKAVRKKGSGPKVKKLNLDEIDDSNSPLRRRSSRLKVLEQKKEEKEEEKKEEEKKEEDNEPVSKDEGQEADDLADKSTDAKPNESEADARADSKDKKKDKRKKDKKRTKKHDKRKSSRRKSSKDDESEEEPTEEKPSDCFTPPASAAMPSDGALKPEKVKSRWRRNSELETGSEPAGKKEALTSSENLIPNPVNSNSILVSPSRLPSASSAKDENTEPMPEFDKINDNIYRFEKKITKFTKEVKKMVCDCILTKEERSRGMMGCGEDCLNRMLMIECGSKCPLENHCANKRFLRRQYSKVEAFKTAKKGWGLRALQPLQPNQFIMEYVGEVIGPDEFSTRVRRFAKEGRKHHFFMALKADEIIDATYRGNITRFVNHSCDPNAETQKWTVNGDLRIGFFSKKFIQPGEEITFNYQFQRYGREAQPCYCESENCRGFIGATDVSDEVDIELDDEESDGDEVSSVKKVKQVKAPVDKLKEEFEDLALEEEIDKLKANGGLQNRHQTLMLARLMVRAEDMQSRFKLLEIIRHTKENACIRLLLDYHGLRLLWSWMVDLEDAHLKAEIIGVLEFLQIPNKTMLKDSKVLEVIEKWTNDKSIVKSTDPKGAEKSEEAKNEEIKSEEVKKLTNGDLLSETGHAALDDKKLDALSADETTQPAADLKSSSHLKNYNIIKKDAKTVADQAQQAKTMPNIAMMATRLLNLWKDLKEVYRIPRLERQKRHEDEKEADRKAMENEAEMNARMNNTASFLRRGTKRPLDGPANRQFGHSNHKQHQPQPQPESGASKISKEEHRTYYNVELMRKDYEEAMKQYKKQVEQFNLAIQQQLKNMNGVIAMPVQPPMPPAPPNIGNLFPNTTPTQVTATVQPLAQQPLTQSPSFPNSYNSSNLYSNDKQANDFKKEISFPEPAFTTEQQAYPEAFTEIDYLNAPAYNQQELVTYNHLPNLYNHQQSTEPPAADVCMESNESQIVDLEKSWNTIYSELTGGLGANTILLTNEQNHAFDDVAIQSDYRQAAEQVDNVSELFGGIYPRPGTYLVSGERTYFMPCNSNGCPPDEMGVECNFDLPSRQPTSRTLPENWKQAQDKNGYYYYYNKVLHKTQYNPPFDRTELQNTKAATKLLSTNADQNVVVSSAADSTSTPKFDTSSIDASKINLATLNEILKMSNGLCGDSVESDPRKRLKLDDDSTELNTALSLEMENKIIKFPTCQKTERRKSTKDRHREIKEIKERFKAGLSEHIKSVLNPYRMHDCRVGKILCDDDFKHVARRLTHEVFGKELKRTKPENLQFNSSVKSKSRDYVQKFMSRQGPFYIYKPPDDRSGGEDDDDDEVLRDDQRRQRLWHSPVNHHHYQTASNSASNSLDTTPRVDTTPKVDTVLLSPKQPLSDASSRAVETMLTEADTEVNSQASESNTEAITKAASPAASVADLITAETESAVPEATFDVEVKRESILDANAISESIAESATDRAISDLNQLADEMEQG